jgi:hypothetical protein
MTHNKSLHRFRRYWLRYGFGKQPRIWLIRCWGVEE